MGEWQQDRQHILFAVLKNPTSLKIREQIGPCETVIGEYLMLDFAVVVPNKKDAENAARLADPLTDAAQVALGTFNSYRRCIRFHPERSAKEPYVRELRVYKEGFPHKNAFGMPVRNFSRSF
jgi:hypothetical protein